MIGNPKEAEPLELAQFCKMASSKALVLKAIIQPSCKIPSLLQ